MSKIAKDEITKRLEKLVLFEKQCNEEIDTVANELTKIFKNNGKLLICGNGGSAADAQHLAAEFVSSFSFGLSRRSLPAIALTTDTSVITAISNDFNFELVFARQVQGLGNSQDALLAISTSGESKNCIAAVEEAKKIGMRAIALTSNPSTLYRLVDTAIGVPFKNTQYVQECHLISYHILADLVERAFL